MSEFVIKTAQRAGAKLKIFLAGPSGSGKTKGALWLARAFVGPQGRICVIDTERESASWYAGEPGIGSFDTIPLGAPYHTDRFVAALAAVIAAGYDLVIIDSITHQWSGLGGVLERKEQLDARGGNNFTNWAKFTPETEKFRNALLEAGIHLIATVRSKQEYVIADQGGGQKSKVTKMGMKPDQREGLEYEFGIGWQLQMDNRAEALKDRTSLFAGKLVDLKDPKVALALRQWVDSGAPEVAAPSDRAAVRAEVKEEMAEIRQAEQPAGASTGKCQRCETPDRALIFGICDTCRPIVAERKALVAAKAVKLAGKADSWGYKGIAYGQKPLADCPTSVLKQASHFFKDLEQKDPKSWIAPQLEAIKLVLAERELAEGQGTLTFPTELEEEAPAAAAAPIDTTLKPGKIEDAIDKPEPRPTRSRSSRKNSETTSDVSSAPASETPEGEQRSDPSRSASPAAVAPVVTHSGVASATAVADAPPATFGGLARHIGELLMHEKFDDVERANFRAKLDKANNMTDMQTLVTELQTEIDRPF